MNNKERDFLSKVMLNGAKVLFLGEILYCLFFVWGFVSNNGFAPDFLIIGRAPFAQLLKYSTLYFTLPLAIAGSLANTAENLKDKHQDNYEVVKNSTGTLLLYLISSPFLALPLLFGLSIFSVVIYFCLYLPISLLLGGEIAGFFFWGFCMLWVVGALFGSSGEIVGILFFWRK